MGLLGVRLMVVLDTNLLDGQELAKLCESCDTRPRLVLGWWWPSLDCWAALDSPLDLVTTVATVSRVCRREDLGTVTSEHFKSLLTLCSVNFLLPLVVMEVSGLLGEEDIIDCNKLLLSFWEVSLIGDFGLSRLILSLCLSIFSRPVLVDSCVLVGV